MDIKFPPVPINESKEKKIKNMKNCGEIIRDLIRSITKNFYMIMMKNV